MIKDSIECGHTIFFHVRVVSGQEGISCGKLYFLKKEYEEAIKASASKSLFLKQLVNGRLSENEKFLAISSPPVTVSASAQPSILASELPPQHHEVEFGLTHKANFPYTPSPKSKFLSPALGTQ
jgi:hypothetical protein